MTGHPLRLLALLCACPIALEVRGEGSVAIDNLRTLPAGGSEPNLATDAQGNLYCEKPTMYYAQWSVWKMTPDGKFS